jgi:hypothetical protein
MGAGFGRLIFFLTTLRKTEVANAAYQMLAIPPPLMLFQENTQYLPMAESLQQV